MTRKSLLNARTLRSLLDLHEDYSLPVTIHIGGNILGLREVCLDFEEEDEKLVDWMMEKSGMA